MAVTKKVMKTFNVPSGSNTIQYEIVDDAGRKMLAPEFATNKAYVVGECVVHDGLLYRFKTAHSAGAWNATQVESTTFAAQINDEKAILSYALMMDEDGDFYVLEETEG